MKAPVSTFPRTGLAKLDGVRRGSGLLLLLLALLLVLVWSAPIAQSVTYHAFADARAWLGISSFWNVASNLAFLAIGALGLDLVRRHRRDLVEGWWGLFGGTALVAVGSSIYHLAPDDASLVWDRLAMGVAFAGLLAALVGEQIGERAGRVILLPAVAFAVFAIAWWRHTGDLSLWIWVQLAPLLAMLLAALVFVRGSRDARYLLMALPWYGAAKLFELADREVFAWSGGAMGGHALKHFGAALGVATLYLMLRARQRSA